jgi:hypothetical protein
MVQVTKLGWFIIGLTLGIINIWAHNVVVGFFFGWAFGKLIFNNFPDDKSNKNQG